MWLSCAAGSGPHAWRRGPAWHCERGINNKANIAKATSNDGFLNIFLMVLSVDARRGSAGVAFQSGRTRVTSELLMESVCDNKIINTRCCLKSSPRSGSAADVVGDETGAGSSAVKLAGSGSTSAGLSGAVGSVGVGSTVVSLSGILRRQGKVPLSMG